MCLSSLNKKAETEIYVPLYQTIIKGDDHLLKGFSQTAVEDLTKHVSLNSLLATASPLACCSLFICFKAGSCWIGLAGLVIIPG